MYRIDVPSASLTMPTFKTPGTPGYFTQGNPSLGIAATVLDQDWVNGVQEELLAVIAAAGITPTKTSTNQLLKSLQTLGRTKAQSNMTFYVATTGSDTVNTGLTIGSPFASVQRAINVIYGNYDWNGFQATVQVADGTYHGSWQTLGQPVGHTNALIIQGNMSNQNAVVFAAVNDNAIIVNLGSFVTLQNFTVTASGTSTTTIGIGYGLIVTGSWCNIQNITFGSCETAQLSAWNGGVCTNNAQPLTFTGTSGIGVNVTTAGYIWMCNSTITMNSPTYVSAFLYAQFSGTISCNFNTFLGAGTCVGQKWIASYNGCITTGAASIPGTVAGYPAFGVTGSTGGQAQ